MPKKVFTGIVLIALVACVYFSSYCFIMEANYHRTQIIEESLFVPNSHNTYFIKNDDFHYEIYINGIYTETIDSIENYPQGIKIYNKKGEQVHEN